MDKFDGIDILVNNAGGSARERSSLFCNSTEEVWDYVISLNLKGVLNCTWAIINHMLEKQSGKIVNIASALAFQGGINVVAYAAAKHGVAGITKALANEWASQGVNVNAIAPGYIATEFIDALMKDPDRSKAILGRTPAGRWGEPDDIAAAAVYLASPASDYVHGSILTVDGGWMAR